MLAAALNSITAQECADHVHTLADDVFEGREAGSRGGHAAATYILREIEPLGFHPAGDDGKFTQSFGEGYRNILAVLPGNDPALHDEYIVVGAHYDHVGYGNRKNSLGTIGRVHNGADDNASGTSALIETMEAFAKSGLTTRRSILFAFWDGEERGLVGSRYWNAHPTVPHDRVKLAITLDMVGRLRDGQLYLLGTRSGYGMRRLFSGSLSDDRSASPLWLDFSWELSENSDHWSFLEQKIPVALLHTGLHADYHRPSDDSHKVNGAGMRDVCQYLLTALLRAGDADQLPAFRSKVTRETKKAQSTFEEPLAEVAIENWPSHLPRPRLGIGWREDEAEPGSVFLTRVVQGTSAAKAGLKVLDRIYEINGKPFSNSQVFQDVVTTALDAGEKELLFLVERQGDMRIVRVELPVETEQPMSNESSRLPTK